MIHRTTFRKTLHLIREDLFQRDLRQGKRFGKFSYVKILLNPPAMAGVVFRFQHWFHGRGWYLFAELLRVFNIILYSVDIGSAAEIGGGLVIYHPNCIVITGKLRAGKNLHLAHHNTIEIGPRPGMNELTDRIEIGDEVVLGRRTYFWKCGRGTRFADWGKRGGDGID